LLVCLVTADEITYGALLNGAAVQRQPRIGMVVHPIAGRHVAVQTAGAPHLWLRLVALIGRPELVTDPRFATATTRRANWPALLAIYREWLSGFDSVEHAVKALSSARVPAVPMLSPEELVQHPQMAARSAFPQIDHPAHGPVRVTALPFHVDQRPVHPVRTAPWRVGQNTRELLSGLLGYTEEQIMTLASQRVVEMPG
jgi:crotonobetainyl-CoA:carnitine CoA-transferase CaiB-like acyl-CoA transferase